MEQGKSENFMRKLHSLSGVIPLGMFMCVHMLLNYTATWGVDAYNLTASFMENLPFKIFLETFVIFLPLCFHAIYGVYIALKAKNNVAHYGYFRNWAFMLQRVTGIITFVFVAWHVWGTRLQVEFGAHPGFSMMADIIANPVFLVLYIIGVVCAIYHFANGIWAFLITWGITLTPKSQKISQYVTMAFFVGFSILGVQALLAFA